MAEHIRNMAGVIKYLIRVALIRDDPIETQYGPGLIESEKSLGDLLSHGASGTSTALLPATQRMLFSVESTSSGERYPLFFIINVSFPDLSLVIAMQKEYNLDFVFFKDIRAKLMNRRIREAVDDVGLQEIRDEVLFDN
jgi:hypothetical protein